MTTNTTPRTFAAVLNSLRHGQLSDEATDALCELTNACSETGRGGKLVLTISIKPGKGRHFTVSDELVLKKPKPEKGESIMFPTPEGFLTRDDPQQLRLDGLTVVERPSGEVVIDVPYTAKAG